MLFCQMKNSLLASQACKLFCVLKIFLSSVQHIFIISPTWNKILGALYQQKRLQGGHTLATSSLERDSGKVTSDNAHTALRLWEQSPVPQGTFIPKCLWGEAKNGNSVPKPQQAINTTAQEEASHDYLQNPHPWGTVASPTTQGLMGPVSDVLFHILFLMQSGSFRSRCNFQAHLTSVATFPFSSLSPYYSP